MRKHTSTELTDIINRRLGHVPLCDRLAKISPSDRRGFEKVVKEWRMEG